MSKPTMGHGHVIPNPHGVRARCGGLAICSVCQEEARLGRWLTDEEEEAIQTRDEADERRAKGQAVSKQLQQAEIHMWFDGSDPNRDPPDEETGIMQGDLAQTQAFAAAVLQRHWDGECMCQGGDAGDADERRAKEGRLLALCGELRLGVEVVERLCERIEREAAARVTEIGPPWEER